jgi:hypothetical protein
MPAAAPAEPSASGTEAPRPFQLHAWPLSLRGVALLAQLVHAANVVHLSALLVLGSLEGALPAPPLYLALRIGLFSLVPLGLVRLLRAWSRATVDVGAEQLVLQLRGVRYEIPYASLDAVRPWRLPLPVPGFLLRMKSGRTFRYGLETGDPLPLLDALGGHGVVAAATPGHPGTRFAQASALARGRWWQLALKYGLFPLVPAVIFFRAHQYIAYGGPFGQWQMFGLRAYLHTFVVEYWVVVLTYLVLYAGLWRGVVGSLAFAGAWVLPTRARGVRRAAEWLCALAYYVGLPALVLARFFL